MTIADKWTAYQDFFQKYVMAQEKKDQGLVAAVGKNDVAAVQRWIRNGANPSPRSSYATDNATLAAIEAGNKDMLKLLLENGASPNGRVDYGMTTPFLLAVDKGNLEIISMLIDAGANINAAGYRGNSPLATAVTTKNRPLADLLLERGAEVNNFSKHGWSPLFYAVNKGDTEMVDVLLARGARTDRRDSEGRNVLNIAHSCEQFAIYNKIQAHIDAQVKPWQLLEDDKIAHVSIMRGLGYKLTEVFNLKTQQYTAITHNYATKADSSATRVLDPAADKNLLTEAEAQLKALKPAAPAPIPAPKPQAQPGT